MSRGIDRSRMSRERRREECEARRQEWQKLTPAQQLKELDKRLGKGKGATKQRARLQAQLEEPAEKLSEEEETG